MKKWIITALLAIGLVQLSYAQRVNRQDFTKVDEYVASLGPMHGSHLKTIVGTLTKHQTIPQIDQVRAIYMWVANNIDYNTAGKRHPKNYNTSASEALNTRKTTDEGYANLLKAMFDLARINSKIVHGMAKFDPRDIGNINDKWNKHTWNAVEINGKWHLIDAAWSAGKTDRKFRYFTRSFTDAWFMTDPELFAMSHYPNMREKQWQLLDTPVNKSVFTQAPIIGTSAIINEVYPVSAKRGKVRGKADTSTKMVFEVGNPSLIKSVSIKGRASDRIPVKYTIEDNLMYVDVPFKTEGDYSFNIYINDDLAYMYQADVSKAKKRPAPRQQPKAKTKKPQPRHTANKTKNKAGSTKQKDGKKTKITKDKTNSEQASN